MRENESAKTKRSKRGVKVFRRRRARGREEGKARKTVGLRGEALVYFRFGLRGKRGGEGRRGHCALLGSFCMLADCLTLPRLTHQPRDLTHPHTRHDVLLSQSTFQHQPTKH